MAETDVTMANSSDDAPTCASDGFWCEGTNNIQKKSAAAAATTATPTTATAAAATTAAAGATAAARTGATAAPATATEAAAGAERSAAAKGGAGGGGGGGEAGTQQKQAGKKKKRNAAQRTSAGTPSSSSSSSSSPSSAGAAAEETAAAEAETPPAAAAANGAGNKKTAGGDTARKENVGEVSMETRKEEEDESEEDEEDDITGKEPPKDEMEDGMSADTAGSPFSDNDDDDMPTDKTKDDEEEDEYSDKSPEERVKLASASKDQGNDIFRAGGAVADAMKAYKSGLKYVKDVYLPEAKSLRVALNSNVAMCCLKLEEWQQAIAAADAALQDEPANVKALYRRGLARASFGLYTDAKADLLQVLRMEPRNADARKELEKLKEKIAKDNTERRKAYSGLFDRAAGMYADREAQMQRKRQEEAEKEAKLRKEWEEEMEKKKEKGEDEVPFEDWKEEREKAREKEKRREAAQHTDSPGGSPGRRRRNTAEARKADSLELDEEDKKIIDETKKMGYCYFRRDLTEEERKLNAQHLPTKIDPSAPSADAAGASAAPNFVAGGAAAAANSAAPNESSNNAHDENAAKAKQQSGVSSWNAKGTTYEEKDMSQWARQRFSTRLLETRIVSPGNQELMKDPAALLSGLPNMGMPANKRKEDALKMLRSLVNQFLRTEVWCTEVKDLSGDAQVVVMRGSKRYLFEFSCTLLFEIAARPEHMTDPQMRERFPQMKDDGFTYSGEMTLPEVSSAEGKGEAWLSGCKLKIKKKVAAEHKDLIDQGVKLFKKKLVDQIHLFLDDFSKAA